MTSSEKIKKPIYKKWWAWAIAVVLIIGIASQSSKKTSANSSISAPANAETPSLDSESVFAEIKLHPDAAWDEEHALKDHFSQGITFAIQAFNKYPKIERVFVKTYMNLMDVNGNEKEEIVFKHTFARAPFLEVHWDKFHYAPIFDQINKSLEGTGYIHPGVAKNISEEFVTSKLYYSP